MLEDAQVIAHYLPPYSPDYNPIEEVFAKVKLMLKAMEQECAVLDIETVLLAAFSTISKHNCGRYIRHSGLY